MGCGGCGKGIRKVGNIARGFAAVATEKVTGHKYEHTDRRVRMCQKCDTSTWMTEAEFYGWIKEQGIINVAKNIADLTHLPDLPRQEYKKGGKLYCQKCKCKIPVKARVAGEHCPRGKW